jgi:hypothetical protein
MGVESDQAGSARAGRERVVLTKGFAGKFSASRSLVRLGAVIGLSAITMVSANAAGVGGLSCVGGARSFSCTAQWAIPGDPHIREVPEVFDEAQRAQTAARDRRWLTRCHPVLGRDAYRVARYQYAAPGCEYGVGAD